MKTHHAPSSFSHLCCSCLCQEQRLRFYNSDLDKLIQGILGSHMNIESSKEDLKSDDNNDKQAGAELCQAQGKLIIVWL